MSEMNANVTNPSEPEAPIPSSRRKHRIGQLILIGGIVLCCGSLVLGLAIAGVQKVQEAAARAQSMNNLKQMGLAMNNIASNTSTGDIPSVYGVFPYSGGRAASFFDHLMPYIEQMQTEEGKKPYWERDEPIKTFIAPADPRNSGMDSTISYCTNRTLLTGTACGFEQRDDGTVAISSVRLPASFSGRTSSLIIVMERSGLDGAHKWTNANNALGTPGMPPPFPQLGVSPKRWSEETPQGFTSAGCCVVFGDASVRVIGKMEPTTWQWACDPENSLPQPSDW